MTFATARKAHKTADLVMETVLPNVILGYVVLLVAGIGVALAANVSTVTIGAVLLPAVIGGVAVGLAALVVASVVESRTRRILGLR